MYNQSHKESFWKALTSKTKLTQHWKEWISFLSYLENIAAVWLSTKADLVIIFYVDIIIEILESTFTLLKYNLLKVYILSYFIFLHLSKMLYWTVRHFSCSYLSQGYVFLHHFLLLQENT